MGHFQRADSHEAWHLYLSFVQHLVSIVTVVLTLKLPSPIETTNHPHHMPPCRAADYNCVQYWGPFRYGDTNVLIMLAL